MHFLEWKCMNFDYDFTEICSQGCPINNIPALVQIMAWRRSGDKALSEPMMDSLLTHICICITRPQCVNAKSSWGQIMGRCLLDVKLLRKPIVHNSPNTFIWSRYSTSHQMKVQRQMFHFSLHGIKIFICKSFRANKLTSHVQMNMSSLHSMYRGSVAHFCVSGRDHN